MAYDKWRSVEFIWFKDGVSEDDVHLLKKAQFKPTVDGDIWGCPQGHVKVDTGGYLHYDIMATFSNSMMISEIKGLLEYAQEHRANLTISYRYADDIDRSMKDTIQKYGMRERTSFCTDGSVYGYELTAKEALFIEFDEGKNKDELVIYVRPLLLPEKKEEPIKRNPWVCS